MIAFIDSTYTHNISFMMQSLEQSQRKIINDKSFVQTAYELGLNIAQAVS